MALMLQSGLPLDEAMERTSELLEGSPLAERFLDCRRRVSEGASFPYAVEDAGVLTGLQAGLLSAGFAPACLRRPWPSWPGAARPKPMSA